MPLTPNVVAGATIATAWGNAIRDRTLQVFTDNADRDAQWTGPPDGAHCLTLDKLAVWVRSGGVWVPLAAEGRPLVTGKTTSDLSADDPTGALVGPKVAFTLAAARCVGASINVKHQRSGAVGLTNSILTIDGTDTRSVVTTYHAVLGGPGQQQAGSGSWWDLAAGTHNAQFRLRSLAGGASAFLLTGSGFSIVDAGPNLGLYGP